MIHPDVPYTSHNSSMCFEAELGEEYLNELISFASHFLLTETAAGSDPGLCIAVANKINNPIVGGICGAFASLSKMAINIILGVLLKVPMIFLTLGIGVTAVSHVLYGMLGGILAAFIVRRLKPRLANWE